MNMQALSLRVLGSEYDPYPSSYFTYDPHDLHSKLEENAFSGNNFKAKRSTLEKRRFNPYKRVHFLKIRQNDYLLRNSWSLRKLVDQYKDGYKRLSERHNDLVQDYEELKLEHGKLKLKYVDMKLIQMQGELRNMPTILEGDYLDLKSEMLNRFPSIPAKLGEWIFNTSLEMRCRNDEIARNELERDFEYVEYLLKQEASAPVSSMLAKLKKLWTKMHLIKKGGRAEMGKYFVDQHFDTFPVECASDWVCERLLQERLLVHYCDPYADNEVKAYHAKRNTPSPSC